MRITLEKAGRGCPDHTRLDQAIYLFVRPGNPKRETDSGRDRRKAYKMTRQVDENWKLQQQTTFTKWVNNALRGHLKKAKTQVNDLQTDLKDGLVLVELIESIASPRKIGRYNKNPKIKPQLLENLGAVFKFLEKEQIKVVNIGKLTFAWL